MAQAPQPTLRPRQELAVRRFTQYCRNQWGNMLLHKVGTGKTITSMAIGLNSFTEVELQDPTRRMFIVSPSSGIYANFVKDLRTRLTRWAAVFPPERLVNYPYSELIEDINNKSWRYDMTGSIVIFDEAHRLLGNEVYNSREAGSRTGRHPILEDIYFINKIKPAKKCIIMTGTPIQVDLADICRLLNFVSQSNKFRTDVFAAITFGRGTAQWATAATLNLLRSTGVEVGALGLKQGAAFVAPYLPSLPALPGAATAGVVTLGVLGVSIIGYGAYEIYKKKKESGVSKGGTRKRQRGGEGEEGDFVTELSKIVTSLGLADILKLTAGPSGPGKPFSTTASKFLVDMGIAQFQEFSEKLYLNNWNVKDLAKAASKYISIYDPDIQVKLLPSSDVTSYNSRVVSQFSPTVEHQRLLDRYHNNSVMLDMPSKLLKEQNLSYDGPQLSLLRRMFTGELTYEELAWLNLDRYEPASPDVKAKFNFFRSFGRMVGNFSPDMLTYYTVINADGTDYELYERTTGNRVDVATAGRVFFECDKFKHCLGMLVRMRTTGTMKNPLVRLADIQAREQPAGPALQQIQAAVNADPNEREVEQAAVELREEAEADIVNEADDIPQPHLDGVNQYLPLVYSYTEDYGLGPFCIYLKSKGFQYILAHTKQAPDVLVATINRGKSAEGQPKFAPMTRETMTGEGADKLCVLLHPSMTEGYDFVYNPAIFVLEPCNTFGDQEQVYGRVLRSYSAQDMETFGGLRKLKLIVQYYCLTDKDSWYITRLNAIWYKGRFWNSRIAFTPQQYLQLLKQARITSPDFYAKERLDTEMKNLRNFQELVNGGVNFSDLIESIACLSELRMRPADIECDPASGVPCAGPGQAPVVAAVAQAEEAAEERDGWDLNDNILNLDRPPVQVVGPQRGVLRYRGPRGTGGYRRTRRRARQ
jgi:hypothetical protein